MIGFETPDWGPMFVPDLSLAESFLRASAVYLLLIMLFRVVLKRQSGSLGLPDIMLVVLVSECVSNSLSANANSIPNGLAAVFGLLFWNYALDRLAYRWPWLERRLESPPLELVKDGEPNRAHMKTEGITDDELAAQLRLNGIDDVAKVKRAVLESAGAVSVIPEEDPEVPAAESPAPPDGPPDFEGVVRRFEAAAADLRKALAWHDRRVTELRGAPKPKRRH